MTNKRTRSAPQTLPSLSVCEVIREERAVSWHGCGASMNSRRTPLLRQRVVDPARDGAVGPAQARWSNRDMRTPGISSAQNGVTARRDGTFSMDRNARADGQLRPAACGTGSAGYAGLGMIPSAVHDRPCRINPAPARSALFHTVRGRYRAED